MKKAVYIRLLFLMVLLTAPCVNASSQSMVSALSDSSYGFYEGKCNFSFCTEIRNSSDSTIIVSDFRTPNSSYEEPFVWMALQNSFIVLPPHKSILVGGVNLKPQQFNCNLEQFLATSFLPRSVSCIGYPYRKDANLLQSSSIRFAGKTCSLALKHFVNVAAPSNQNEDVSRPASASTIIIETNRFEPIIRNDSVFGLIWISNTSSQRVTFLSCSFTNKKAKSGMLPYWIKTRENTTLDIPPNQSIVVEYHLLCKVSKKPKPFSCELEFKASEKFKTTAEVIICESSVRKKIIIDASGKPLEKIDKTP